MGIKPVTEVLLILVGTNLVTTLKAAKDASVARALAEQARDEVKGNDD